MVHWGILNLNIANNNKNKVKGDMQYLVKYAGVAKSGQRRMAQDIVLSAEAYADDIGNHVP